MKNIVKGFVIIMLPFALLTAQTDSFNGLVFYNYQHDFEDGGKSQFEFTRVYLTYTKKLSDNLKYKFQTDVGRHKNKVGLTGAGSDSLAASLTNSKWLSLYLKNAKLDWTTGAGRVTIGLQGMNMFNVPEKTWGHRYLQKSPMDLHKFASSADLGIGIARKVADNISVSLLITNGTGYKSAENDAYKKYSVQALMGRKNLSKKNGYNAGIAFSYEPFELPDESTGSTTVTALFGGWSSELLRVGTEFDFNTATDKDAIQLYSAYATLSASNKLGAIFRVDQLNEGESSELYVILGGQWTPEKGLRIVPNLQYTKGDSDQKSATSLFVNFEFKI